MVVNTDILNIIGNEHRILLINVLFVYYIRNAAFFQWETGIFPAKNEVEYPPRFYERLRMIQ